MTLEIFTLLTLFVLLISVLINIILFIRIDTMYKMLRFMKVSAHAMYLELEAIKRETQNDRTESNKQTTAATDGEA